MKRRDFNRFALSIGLGPILATAKLLGLPEARAQGTRCGVILEVDDLQHIVITRVPALTGRYEFLSFRDAAQGRAWLAGILDKIASVEQTRNSLDREQRWVSVAFTWQGLRALGVDEQSLATFPKEFQEGMAARAEVLGDTGRNSPDKWVGSLASPALHAIAILFARNAAERERITQEHQAFLTTISGVQALSSLDLDGIPPFDHAHEHFGYRDRLSETQIEGSGIEPTPGWERPSSRVNSFSDTWMRVARWCRCPSRKRSRETALLWLIADCSSTSALFATFSASMVDQQRKAKSWSPRS